MQYCMGGIQFGRNETHTFFTLQQASLIIGGAGGPLAPNNQGPWCLFAQEFGMIEDKISVFIFFVK